MKELFKLTSIVLIAFGLENIISPIMPAWLMVISGILLYLLFGSVENEVEKFKKSIRK